MAGALLAAAVRWKEGGRIGLGGDLAQRPGVAVDIGLGDLPALIQKGGEVVLVAHRSLLSSRPERATAVKRAFSPGR
jgi:hypothetical protein